MSELEQLVKRRSVARTIFTKARKELDGILRSKETDRVQVSFQSLEKKNQDLQDLNRKIFDLKLVGTNEDELVKEVTKNDEYEKLFLEAQVSVNKIFLFDCSFKTKEGSSSSSSEVTIRETKRKFKLPKLELRKFNGEVKEWLQFWGQFEKIHNDSEIDAEDKFQYLIQATVKGSRAREVVESFPPTAANYPQVIDSLKSRFGREELLVEVYVRELLKIVLKNASSSKPTSLSSLYDNIESHVRALATLGVTSEKCAAMLYPLVESCLPEECLRAWQRSQNCTQGKKAKNKLESLTKFLQNEVESEERIKLAMDGFGFKNESKSKKKQVSEFNEIDEEATAASLLVTNQTANKASCIFCEKQHEASNCFKAQGMNLSEKMKMIKNKRACYKCLKTGHPVRTCGFKVKCVLCRRPHYALMCPKLPQNKESKKVENGNQEKKLESEPTEENSIGMANITSSSKVFLQTLVVRLKGPHKVHKVRALMDSGSQRSYVMKDTAAKAGYLPTGEVVVKHCLFGGRLTEGKPHNCFRITLANLEDNYNCDFEALEQHTICDTIPTVTKGPWSQELEQLKIHINDNDQEPGPIEILIGADVLGSF